MRKLSIFQLAFCVIGFAGLSYADTLAMQYTSEQTSVCGIDCTLGFAFTTTSAVTVDALDYEDPGTGGVAEIYDSGGHILAQTTVNLSDPTVTTGSSGAIVTYNVAAIYPLHLAAGETYYFAVDDLGTTPNVVFGAVGLTSASGISYVGSVSQGGYGTPTTDAIGDPNSFFAGNFEVASPAPEPDFAVPVALLAGVLLLASARRRKRARS